MGRAAVPAEVHGTDPLTADQSEEEVFQQVIIGLVQIANWDS